MMRLMRSKINCKMKGGDTATWRFVLLLGAVLMTTSCGSTDDGPSPDDNFDQKGFLVHLGSSVILPAYEQLAQTTALLQAKAAAVAAAPDVASLAEAREALFAARIAWQHCAPYQFGPAESMGLASNANIFPVDRTKIERNIEQGNYNLEAIANNNAKGFAAIEYLLYGMEQSAEDVVAQLAGQPGRGAYINAVADLVASTAKGVFDEWKATGGNYIGEFTSDAALGADAGSSLGKLVNALNLTFERNTRDAKIGIPAGIRSLGIVIPESTEAYYAGYSLELAVASVQAYKALFFGLTADGTDGPGFDDYLRARSARSSGNTETPLDEAIAEKIEAVLSALDVIDLPLAEQIKTDNAPVQQVFAEMQRLAVLLKTDMASALGVVISYQDNDGD